VKTAKSKWAVGVALAVILLVGAAAAYFFHSSSGERVPLTVAISPYQDLAMLTAYKKLGLEDKYGTSIKLVTLPWEEVQPSLASAGRTVDVGFGSLIEFLTKYQNVNTENADPLVYVFPTYVFKGGGFVSFNKDVPNLDQPPGFTADQVSKFFSFRIGAQKNSMFDMMIYTLARQAKVPIEKSKLLDTTMGDGLLAAEGSGLDVAAAGMTQRNEALEKGGRVVLTMDKLGFADLTGIISRKSTLERRRHDIENLIRMWFDSVDYIYSDIDHNAAIPIAYLDQTASTKYTVASFKQALEAEYLPRSLSDANRDLIASNGSFSIQRISSDISAYLVEQGIAKRPPPTPVPLDIRP
jgi:ABC-type nitrate/sulfonate/bicarbonate transport system substrate-binding protein